MKPKEVIESEDFVFNILLEYTVKHSLICLYETLNNLFQTPSPPLQWSVLSFPFWHLTGNYTSITYETYIDIEKYFMF